MENDQQHSTTNPTDYEMSDYPITTNGKAITSLVLGILSVVNVPLLFILSPIFSILGFIFGMLGLKEVKRTGQNGRGMAIAGNICSIVGFVLSVLFIIFAIIGISAFMQQNPNSF
ncbi:uncharacterized membrane protein YuzA (DUF378 family) [Salibacterium salarium]|uniref:DUF4190 domain-containing protein n=1 Tax=Salibacterium salarium TaxID=284579 RepID=UPI0027869746|nr:DUF4190 domain-containing protein [Salibacterium salarium]MDQ0297671.1 uncharacterized membrane protein YuzA (DUF378 family) [Salibacterium salarium]